jgi:hypothetical protein
METEPVPGRVFLRVMSRAVANRLGLSVSGVAMATALMLQSGTLAVTAVGCYLVALAVEVGRPSRWQQAAVELRDAPPELPSADCFSDSTAREFIVRLERARHERVVVVSSLTTVAREAVVGAVERACTMEEKAVPLLRLLERVSRYLSDGSTGLARDALTRLRQSADQTAPGLRQEYDEALYVMTERLAALEYSDNCRCLLVAKLEAIVGGLESVPARLMAVELGQATLSALDGGPSLHDLLEEIHTLEEASTVAVSQQEVAASSGVA